MNRYNKRVSRTIVALILLALSVSLTGCAGEAYEYDEDFEDYYNDSDYEDFDEEYMDDFNDSMPSDEDFYEGDSYDRMGYGEVYYPATRGCDPSVFGKRGSASEMEGKTVVVSIFLDDAVSSWSESDADVELMYTMKDYLGMACDWISNQAADYGTNMEFIYDWEQDEELAYQMQTDLDIAHDESGVDRYMGQQFDLSIDTDYLMSKYSADNMLYLAFVNTPIDSDITSYTMNYYEGIRYPYEACYIFTRVDGYLECPAGIAHEILHAYGAPDLYCADIYGDNYGVSEELVNYYEEKKSNDIMFTNYDCITGDSYYDRITNEFTPLDAYYCGIADRPAEADEWGLSPSEHEY